MVILLSLLSNVSLFTALPNMASLLTSYKAHWPHPYHFKVGFTNNLSVGRGGRNQEVDRKKDKDIFKLLKCQNHNFMCEPLI